MKYINQIRNVKPTVNLAFFRIFCSAIKCFQKWSMVAMFDHFNSYNLSFRHLLEKELNCD